MNQKLDSGIDKDTAEEIIYACNIAIGEVGGMDGLEDLITKMYKMHPELLLAKRKEEEKSKNSSEKQSRTRKEIAQMFFEELDLTQPITPQLSNLYIAYDIFKDNTHRDEHWYDEWLLSDVCLCGDLMRFYGVQLLASGLLEEMKAIADSDFEKFQYSRKNLESVDSYWFFLHEVLQRDYYAFRDFNKENPMTPCCACGNEREQNGTFNCNACRKKFAEEEEKRQPYDHEKEANEYRAKRKAFYKKVEEERDQILKDAGLA